MPSTFPSSLLFAAVDGWVATWLTPIWIVSLGVALAAISLMIAWGITMLISQRAGWGALRMVREGPLWPMTLVFGTLALFVLPGAMIVHDPMGMIRCIPRVPFTGTSEKVYQVAPGESELSGFSFRNDELIRLSLATAGEAELRVTTVAPSEATARETFLAPGQKTSQYLGRFEIENRFPQNEVEQLYVENLSNAPIELRLGIISRPVYPQISTIPYTFLLVLLLMLSYPIQQLLFPRMGAIALATAKNEMAQPPFMLTVIIGATLLMIFVMLPYNTFGEDIKILKGSSLSLIMVLSIGLAVWAASNSISDEVEGKTALTILSKPVSRRAFILGKLMGILWTVAVIFVLLSPICLLTVCGKTIYDAREMAADDPAWQLAFAEMVQTVPGLILAFFEAVVMASISVAISTRLPMLANMVICLAIYVVGHITPLIVLQSSDLFEPVAFVGTFLATIFPVLDHFNIQPAIAGGVTVPGVYLAWSMLYCILYSAVAMLLALTLFEDRDLA